MNKPAFLKLWPEDPRDAMPLALWDSAEIAEVTGGKASHEFQAVSYTHLTLPTKA